MNENLGHVSLFRVGLKRRSQNKTVGPDQCLIFSLNTVTIKMTASIPKEKVKKYGEHNKSIPFLLHCSHGDLQKLFGQLNWVTIIYPDSAFLWCLYDLVRGPHEPKKLIT